MSLGPRSLGPLFMSLSAKVLKIGGSSLGLQSLLQLYACPVKAGGPKCPEQGVGFLERGSKPFPMHRAVLRPSSGFPASSVLRMTSPIGESSPCHLRGQPFRFPLPNSALVSPSPCTLYITTIALQNLCDI